MQAIHFGPIAMSLASGLTKIVLLIERNPTTRSNCIQTIHAGVI
jgi:hypothetical protein